MATKTTVNIINSLGPVLKMLGLVPEQLEVEKLIQKALDGKLTSSSEQLAIREALEYLVGSIKSEAALSPVGLMAAHRQIVEGLEAFARVKQARKTHSQIKEQLMGHPVFITGLPRTGSTILHSLLAQDPQIRVPATWEVMRPPIARDDEGSGIKYCDKRLGLANWLAPEFQSVHPMGARLPQECIAITAYVFRSIVFHTTMNLPAYENWFEDSDQAPAYRFHREFLQHLQYFNGGGNWVLKAPGHMFGIGALLDEYPDATIIQTHRDPLKVAPSLASHSKVLRHAFSDAVNDREAASDWLDRWWQGLDLMLEARSDKESCFYDVFYGDFMQEPLEVIEKLYTRLGWEFSSEAQNNMAAFLSANPKGKHGKHRYTLQEFDLDANQIRTRLDTYVNRFSLKPE